MSTLVDVFPSYKSASGQAFTGPGRLGGYAIKPGGTAGSILFYDNTSATGSPVVTIDISTDVSVVSALLPGNGVRFSNGCYIVLPLAATITIFYG